MNHSASFASMFFGVNLSLYHDRGKQKVDSFESFNTIKGPVESFA